MAPEEDIHSCSYYCGRPACIKAQRDELRNTVERLDTELTALRDKIKNSGRFHCEAFLVNARDNKYLLASLGQHDPTEQCQNLHGLNVRVLIDTGEI